MALGIWSDTGEHIELSVDGEEQQQVVPGMLGLSCINCFMLSLTAQGDLGR